MPEIAVTEAAAFSAHVARGFVLCARVRLRGSKRIKKNMLGLCER